MHNVSVYRVNETRACMDPETGEFIDGTKENPQNVQQTLFVSRKIKSGELIIALSVPIPAPSPPQTEAISLEAFTALNAGDQKELLTRLEITGDDSNEEKRVALYTAYLAQAQ